MFRSHLAIALRHLVAQRLYSTINVLGLAVGLAAAMLLGLYVRHELSYDRFFVKADRTYRLARSFKLPNGEALPVATMPVDVVPLLPAEFAEVETAARLQSLSSNALVTIDGQMPVGGWLAAIDDAFLDVFEFDWLEGSPATALRDPHSIVLAASTARRYFGETAALGRTLESNELAQSFTVTGVIRDLPDNTHLRFDMLVPLRVLDGNNGVVHTYVLMRPGASVRRLQAGAHDFLVHHMPDGLGAVQDFVPEPLMAVHLAESRYDDMRPKGSAVTVYASGVIAALILAIACINFVNLATASARRRAKEVGVRKTLGVGRPRLVVQFLGESLLLTAAAALLALAAVELLLPLVGAFLEMDLELDYRRDPVVLGALAAVTVLVGLAAGMFPAFYVAAFEPAKVLKGDLTRGRGAATVRRVLVGAQFAISIALTIATAVVYRQVMFMRTFDVGFDKTQIVVVSDGRAGLLAQRWEVLKREWLAESGVAAVSGSSAAPGGDPMRDLIHGEGGDPEALPVNTSIVAVDSDFLSTYGIEVLAGRGFSSDFGADSLDAAGPRDLRATRGAIVNVATARALGWTPDEAVGKAFWGADLTAPAMGPSADQAARRIVGVIDDVHFAPLRDPVGPMMLILPQTYFNTASIKLTGGDVAGTLARIDAVWARAVPERPIARRFLDDDFDRFYRGERKQAQMLGVCSSLAILVASLGLFGLAALTTEQRTKEIGIRKVMGGSVVDIVRLFTGELSRLAVLANAVAW